VKEILVNDMGHSVQYFERVSAFTVQDFEDMFLKAGLQVVEVKGDYSLNDFTNYSDRMIFVLKEV
ncbi:MAG TPA: hypothetical protein VL947_10405, partial [Cytophagales bacterium]|nr:hypothetical protein [Cytophagales bacterium]